jgi:hypothetical protein
MFLVNVEVFIVGIALVPIIEDLKGVEHLGICHYRLFDHIHRSTIVHSRQRRIPTDMESSNIFGRKYRMASSLFFFTGDPDYHSPTWRQRLWMHSLARLHMPGCFLLLAPFFSIVAVLLEGGISIAWNSGVANALFVVSGIAWIAFLANEWLFSKCDRTLEPISPWQFMHNREWMGTLL